MDEKLKVSLEKFKNFQMNQLKKKKSQYKKQANYSERKSDIIEEKDEYEDKKSKNTKRGEDSANSKSSNSSDSLLQKMTIRTKSPKTKSNKGKNIINEDNNTLLDKKNVKKVVQFKENKENIDTNKPEKKKITEKRKMIQRIKVIIIKQLKIIIFPKFIKIIKF